MKINVVAVGKIKEKFLSDGIAEYAKRLSRFCEFRIVEIGEHPRKNGSAAEIALSKEAEGKGIFEKLSGYVVALAIDGEQLSSPALAEKIRFLQVSGVSDITFVIGGSDGLSDEVLRRADAQLSFGKCTYPHQLMRLILSEQIYRAFTILNNLPYHK